MDREEARPDLRDRRISIRVTELEKALIEQAARIDRISAGEFMVRAALHSAEEVLAEQRHFALTPQEFAAFTAALDRPPRRIAGLTRAARQAPAE